MEKNKSKNIFADCWNHRKLVASLAKNDLKTRFAGSYLGTIWAFVQPIVTILVYWFVFQVGLKQTALRVDGLDVPYVLWLCAGMIPWFFFQDALNGGSGAMTDYNYLVKKVVFNIDILPAVKIISSLFVHVILVVVLVLFFAVYRFIPDLYTIQVVYYSFAMIMLVLGLSYLTSALVVFFRDLKQLINVILQVGVWMTPILWNIKTMDKLSPVIVNILKLNPMYYITSGYRDALVYKEWFFDRPAITLYFWAFTIISFVIGRTVFRRLKVHFADVL